MSDDILNLPEPPPGERITYGEHESQFADLRVPAGPGPHPVLVMIHGGFWRSYFDLVHLGYLCAALTRAGYATWSLEYRRLGGIGGGWPGTFDDVAAGAAHLTTIAAKHKLDLSRVVTMGHSAGGQLALWLAARHKLPARAPPVLPIKGVVALAAVSDLRQGSALHLSDGVVNELLGGDPTKVPERYAYASPVESLPLGLPQVLVHGTNDEIVPCAMSESYERKAVAVHDPARLVALQGLGHFEPIDPRSAAWPRVLEAVKSVM